MAKIEFTMGRYSISKLRIKRGRVPRKTKKYYKKHSSGWWRVNYAIATNQISLSATTTDGTTFELPSTTRVGWLGTNHHKRNLKTE